MTFDPSCCWQLRRDMPGEEPSWLQRTGVPGRVRYTICQIEATRYTEEVKNKIGNLLCHTWVKLDTKKEVVFPDIKKQLLSRPMWKHALTVIDVIEERMNTDPDYEQDVFKWLDDPAYSTVWLRDKVMEPLRDHPVLVAIGKQFNPTTEWHNTWMPLDSAIYHARLGIDLEP